MKELQVIRERWVKGVYDNTSGRDIATLFDEIQRLRGALKQYADEINWSVETPEGGFGCYHSIWNHDHEDSDTQPWKIAKQALEGDNA